MVIWKDSFEPGDPRCWAEFVDKAASFCSYLPTVDRRDNHSHSES